MSRGDLNSPLRRILIVTALVAVVAALVLPATAGADPAPVSVKISENAQFVAQFQIDVPITIDCAAGAGYWLSVNVVQPQGFGFTVFGNGWTSGQCTGQQQKLAVAVYQYNPYGFGWQLGDAAASTNVCAFACDSDTKQIHIGL